MPEVGEIRRGSEIGRPNRANRYIWHACTVCGKTRWVQYYNGVPQSSRCLDCANHEPGRGLRGSDNPNWKGGRHKSPSGYIVIKLPKGDFFCTMADRNRYIYEHRLVMARHLSRCLLSWEVVHHRNGIKDDNRLDNLQLLSSQTTHVGDSQMKRYMKKLEKRVSFLETQVVQLEAELVLLRTGGRNAVHS